MGQQLLPQATDLGLRSGIQLHIVQTQNQIVRLQQVFGLLGFATPLVKPSLVAQALITDAQQLVSITTNAAARDSVIDASLDKVERFEVASYRPLYICALVPQPADHRADRAEPAGGGADGGAAGAACRAADPAGVLGGLSGYGVLA